MSRAEPQQHTTSLSYDTGLAYLRILLMGQHWSGKRRGDIILGGSIFKTDHRSECCEIRQGEVAGRHVTVVDVPGWFYNSTLQDTSEMDKLEIKNSVCLCLPGPHAVLLLVPVDKTFTKSQRVAVEQHMSLLPRGVWSHTMVLFTYGDCLGDRSIEQHIEAEGEDLHWLVDKCGNRYHVFNNDKRDDTQVTQLLEKIEQMVAGNRGGHYEVDKKVAEKLSERKRNIEEQAQTLMTKTHRQRAALKVVFEGEHQSLPDVRVMLVGGKRIGRHTAGEYILQESVFLKMIFKEFQTQTKPQTECVRQQRQVAGRNVSVVICPDWSTAPPSQKIKDVLQDGVTLCSPGPHAVLVNVPVKSSFSEADRRSVEEHMELLGDRVWRHALVLFTCGWWLGGRRVEEYIESEGEALKWLLEKCGYRYHVLHFSDRDISEVTVLMEKIEDMVTRNRGHFGPLDSREDRSVRDTGYSRVGHETRQMTLFERLTGKYTYIAEWNKREDEWKKTEEAWRTRELEWMNREEEWKRREEEMLDRMLKFVVMEPEKTTLPAVRIRHSMDKIVPSMSGGTPSEAKRSYGWTPKVSDWLLKIPPGPIAPSSGYETVLTEYSSQPSPQNPGCALKPKGHVGRFEVLQLGLDDMNAHFGSTPSTPDS